MRKRVGHVMLATLVAAPMIAHAKEAHYLPSLALCDADIGTLEKSNPFVLTQLGFANRSFACEWTQGRIIYDTNLKTRTTATCSTETKTWSETYVLTVPEDGIVTLRPANTDMNATRFHRCAGRV